MLCGDWPSSRAVGVRPFRGLGMLGIQLGFGQRRLDQLVAGVEFFDLQRLSVLTERLGAFGRLLTVFDLPRSG